MLKKLLDNYSVDIESKNKFGDTPVKIAEDNGDPIALKLLLKYKYREKIFKLNQKLSNVKKTNTKILIENKELKKQNESLFDSLDQLEKYKKDICSLFKGGVAFAVFLSSILAFFSTSYF